MAKIILEVATLSRSPGRSPDSDHIFTQRMQQKISVPMTRGVVTGRILEES